MPNEVWFSIPNKPLGKADVEFRIWRDDKKYGTLQVSKGTVVWFPSKTTYGYRMGWKAFNELMVKHATTFERRR